MALRIKNRFSESLGRREFYCRHRERYRNFTPYGYAGSFYVDNAFMRPISDLLKFARQWLNQPVGDLSHAQRAARFAVDLTRHCAGQLRRDKAPQMAAALTYRTIFSLIPLAVLMLLVFRAFGDFDQVRLDWQDQLFDYLGLSSIKLASNVPENPVENTSSDAIEGPTFGEGLPRKTPIDSPTQSLDETSRMTAAVQPAVSPSSTDLSVAPEDSLSNGSLDDATLVDGDQSTGDEEPSQGSADTAEAQRVLQAGIDKIVVDLTEKTANVSFGSIGMVGLAVLIWAGLSLVITVEQTFNQIYQAPDGRPWHMRILLYWSVVTLGPVLLFVSFNVVGTLIDWLGGLDSWGLFSRSLQVLSGFLAVGATWLLIFLLYVLMPNTHVRLRAALIGAFVAAILWESSKWGFKLYVTKAVSYSALYGSLGLLPLFLLWLYLTWLIVLFGLEITSTLQTMRGKKLRQDEIYRDPRQHVNPYWIIPLMTEVAGEFTQGRVIAADALAQRLGVSMRTAGQLSGLLEEAGLLRRVLGDGDHSGGYALAMPPQNIELTRLIDLGQSLIHHHDDRVDRLDLDVMKRLEEAQKQAVAQTMLADLVSPPDGRTEAVHPR